MRGGGSALPAVTLVGDTSHFVGQVKETTTAEASETLRACKEESGAPGSIGAVGRRAGASKAHPTTFGSLTGRGVSGTKSQSGGGKTSDHVETAELQSH